MTEVKRRDSLFGQAAGTNQKEAASVSKNLKTRQSMSIAEAVTQLAFILCYLKIRGANHCTSSVFSFTPGKESMN